MFNVTTNNGGKTNISTKDYLLDLFFRIGASRGKDLMPEIRLCFSTDPVLTTKLMLWSRDSRGGAGEREHFRDFLAYIGKVEPELAVAIMPNVVEVGRWDDLLALLGTEAESYMIDFWLKDIINTEDGKSSLSAKWFPRKGKMFSKTLKRINAGSRSFTPKELRKLVVGRSNTVEQLMCAKKFHHIEFSKLPSKAHLKYINAFERNVPNLYTQYKTALSTGEAKVNSKALTPGDVVSSIYSKTPEVLDAMWEALPDFVGKSSFLPVVDVSGSMMSPLGGINTKRSCLTEAIALGMYLAERNKTPLKDHFMTFSETPAMVKLRGGGVVEKFAQIKRSSWGFNTDLAKTFELIVKSIKESGASQENVPDALVILSDMEFDSCGGYGVAAPATQMERAKQLWAAELPDLTMPTVVFWNLRARAGNNPVTKNEQGVVMISGYTTAIAKAIFSGEEVPTPLQVMLNTINKPRYEVTYG